MNPEDLNPYMVVRGGYLEMVSSTVNELITNHGYMPIGGLTVEFNDAGNPQRYSQAIYKRPENDN